MKVSSITVTFAAVLLSSVPTWAADLESMPLDACAVSQVNGKLEAAGGYIDDLDEGSRFQGVGSLSFPLGCLWGAQVDVGGGSLDGDHWGGTGCAKADIKLITRRASPLAVGRILALSSLISATLARVRT